MTVANEPNRPDEWGGAPDPAAYARYLRDVTEALRRVSSVQVLVLNGALDAYAPSPSFGTTYAIDSERFMEGMIAEVPDVFERLDGWASHAYPLGPFGEEPGKQKFQIDDVRPNAPPAGSRRPGIPNRGVNGYAWELWKLRELGVGKRAARLRHRERLASHPQPVAALARPRLRHRRRCPLRRDGRPGV